MTELPQAAKDVLAERQRQIEVEGWTLEHDDGHVRCELARTAMCYAMPDTLREHIEHVNNDPRPEYWPWVDLDGWKPKSYRANLVRAGALIIAEIERVDRLNTPPEMNDED